MGGRLARVIAVLALLARFAEAARAQEPAPAEAAAPATTVAPEIRYQFDHHGTPSVHTFVLKWVAPDQNLQAIDVITTETNEKVQTLAVPQEGLQLKYAELIEKEGQTKDKFIESTDYNFDQYADLRLTRQWPYKVGEKQYLIFLFDKNKNQYVLHDGLSALPGVLPIPKVKMVETTKVGEFGASEYETKRYKVEASGKVTLQVRIKQRMKDERRLAFIREIRERGANGELQRVCKVLVPAVGKPQRLWGKRKVCDKYLDKDYPYQ